MTAPSMYPSPAAAAAASRMSAGPRPKAQNARSSRRGGSAAPRVTLGGGVGALGQGNAGSAGLAAGAYAGFGGTGTAARAPAPHPIKVTSETAAYPGDGGGGFKADGMISPTSSTASASTSIPSPVPSQSSDTTSRVSPVSATFNPLHFQRSPEPSAVTSIPAAGPPTGASSLTHTQTHTNTNTNTTSRATPTGSASATGSLSSVSSRRRAPAPPSSSSSSASVPTAASAQTYGTPASISGNSNGNSQASLATTASSSGSSRTLKTPHLKTDGGRSFGQTPHITGNGESPLPLLSSAEFQSPANMLVARSPSGGPPSPTPRRVSEGKVGASMGMGMGMAMQSHGVPMNSGADSKHALPPLPEAGASSRSAPNERSKGKLAPLRTDPARLSQDWVEVPSTNAAAGPSSSSSPTRASPTKTKPVPKARLPAPHIIPIKSSSPSPTRPSFDRSNTAPVPAHTQVPASPTPRRRTDGRQSLDQLRAMPSATESGSLSPYMQSASHPPRSSSKSTPPSVVMASAHSGSSDGDERSGLFKAISKDARKDKGSGHPRKSSDMLKRPSMDIFARKDKQGGKDKDKDKDKAMKVLGMGTPPASTFNSPSTPFRQASGTKDKDKEDRKASASLSLKKSSGALKALFRSGKGKDKGEAVPAMPLFSKDAYGQAGDSVGRRSMSTADERPRAPFARSVTPSTQSIGSPGSFDSPMSDIQGQSRSSFSAERSFFPTPPSMHRAVSDGPQFLLGQSQSQSPSSSAPCPPLKIAPATPPKNGDTISKRKATPRLPPAPHGRATHTPEWQAASLPPMPTSGTETSLAYMARQSVMYDYGEEPSFGSPDMGTGGRTAGSTGGRTPPAVQPLGLFANDATFSRHLEPPISAAESNASGASGASGSASGSKGGSSASRSTFESGLPSVKSLHLLSLPDFDFSMDVSFDRFSSTSNAGGSPSTPRKSPRRSMSLSRSPGARSRSGSPTPSPSRALTMRHNPTSPDHLSPTSAHGVKVERRRSQSFDGTGAHAGTILSELWRRDADDGYVSPNVARLFGNPQSNSAPLLSKQLLTDDKGQCTGVAGVPQHMPEAAEPALPGPLGFGPIDFSIPPGSFGAYAPEMSYNGSKDTCSGSSSNGLLRTSSERSSSPSPSPPATPPENKTHFGLAAAIEMDEKKVHPRADSAFALGPATTTPTGPAPAIPLPLLPVAEIKEAPVAAVENTVEKKVEEKEELAVLVKPPAPALQTRTLIARSRAVSISQTPAYDVLSHELDNLLRLYRFPPGHLAPSDRANLVRNDLVGLLSEIDRRAYDASQETSGVYGVLRRGCFDWAETLLDELRTEQPAHERGACLEGLAAVIESNCLSERSLAGAKGAEHAKRFTSLMTRCMSFVMGKLGAKGVFHNTLLFSGRFLAFAFFRIPHIAEQLVTVLQPARGALMRFTRSMLVNSAKVPEEAKPVYPEHLVPLCFDDSRSYTARLAKLSPTFATAEERIAFLFQAGNWLRRWQSDDSELFPAFYRAYHRQLAIYLAPAIQHYEAQNQALPVSVLLRAPGYAHLATIFATKCHSYILGSVNAVTTSSSVNNFEAQETAGFRGSQKPAVLETANRRLVETLSTFANLRITVPTTNVGGGGDLVEVDGAQLYGSMIDAWTRNLISKTSLYAPKAVFSLFDLLDGIVDSPYPLEGDSPSDVTPEQRFSLLDVPHLIWTVRIILTQGEHALTLVKAIAFVFTHWEALTARPEDRRTLCLELLLQRELFERLLLFWSQSVRSYILRLVVFRLGHLHTTQQDGDGHAVEIESVKLLQTRLDHIKSRHDELEPKPESDSAPSSGHDARPVTPVQGQGGTLTRSRSTITMVQDSPSRTGSANKAERLLGLGFGMENKDDEARIKSKSSLSASSAAGWFKKLGKKGKKDGSSSSRSPSPSPNMSLSPSPNFASPAKTDNSPLVPAEAGPSRSPNANGTGLQVPQLRTAPSYSQRSPVESPFLAGSPTLSSESGGSESPIDGAPKKTPPPLILTSSPTSPSVSNGVAFEFELPLASPRSDSFDPAPNVPPSPRKNQPASPGPASPHMSKTFSKRSSLLPPKTASVIEGLIADQGNRSSLPSVARSTPDKEDRRERGYDKKLHAYAIRMLAELEDAQKEYDEWWSETGVGRMDGAPPRLAVAWPFHEGED